jgi:hypothetical protein
MEREADILACCNDGLSVNQTARELRLTPGQVTAVRKRLKLTFKKGRSADANVPEDYHSAIASMRPLEAIEYLTHLLDQILWQSHRHGLEPIEGCRLTQKEAQLTWFLHQRTGHVTSIEAIMHALYSDRASGEMPDTHVVTTYLCKIRRKLAPHAAINRSPLGVSLVLASRVTLDWTRGIGPAVHPGRGAVGAADAGQIGIGVAKIQKERRR